MSDDPSDPQNRISRQDDMRTDILRAERKLVDMELTVAELKGVVDKLRDIDVAAVNNLKGVDLTQLSQMPEMVQRLDDLEDLIMIEGAGVEEIKGMLEDLSSGSGSQLPADASQKLAAIDDLNRRLVEIEGAIASLGDSSRLPVAVPSQMDSEDLQKINRNISAASSRIDALESVSRGISEDVENVRSMIQKFETFEKATTISKDLRQNMDDFRALEEDFKKMRDVAEFAKAGKTLQDVREMVERNSKKISEMDERMSRMGKLEDLGREFPEMRRQFEDMAKVAPATRSVLEDMARRLNVIESKMQKGGSQMGSQEMNSIGARMEQLERKISEMDLAAIQRSVREMSEMFDQMEKRFGDGEKPEDLQNNFSKIQQELEGVKEDLADKASIADVEPAKNRIAQMEHRMSEVREMREDVEKIMYEARKPLDVVSLEISDLMSRLVAIETRLSGLENVISNTQMMRPIILE